MKDNFTEQQREIVARKMGFDGPMQNFSDFLMSSPATATQYSAVAAKLGQKAQGFAAGGAVDTSMTPTKIFEDFISSTGEDPKIILASMKALMQSGAGILLRENNSVLFIDKHMPRIVATILATKDTGKTLESSFEVLINKVRTSGIMMAYGIEENENLKQAYIARGFKIANSDVPEYQWRVLIK